MSEVKITVFETGKEVGYIQSFPESPSLKEMQEIVGGLIQVVPFSPTEFMVVNEEGLLLDLPVNDLANEALKITNPNFANFNVIVGNCFLIKHDEFE